MMNLKRHNIYVLISFVIISIISSFLLIKSHALYSGVDLPFHIERLENLIVMIKHHVLSPTFSFNVSHGSSIMFTYPYISIIPLAFLSLFMSSKIFVVYLYFDINIFISLIICYYSSLNFSKSIKISYLFSLIYSMSNVLLGFSFVSSDLGIEEAYIYLPIVIFGFVDIINNYNNYYKLSFGLSLIIFSHVLTTIIVLIFLGILIISNLNKFNKNILEILCKSMILTGLITSFITLPLIVFMYDNQSYIHTPSLTFLRGISTVDFVKSSLGGLNPSGIGLFPSIAAIFSILFYKKFDKTEHKMIIISIIFVIFCSKLFPWKLFSSNILYYFKYFQSTYRFLIIPIFLLSYIYSVFIVKYCRFNYLFYLSIILIIMIQLFGQWHLISSMKFAPEISKISLNKYYKESPEYKIKRSNQIKLISKLNYIENYDYYPKNSLYVKTKIHNNDATYNSNKIIHVYNIGYNKIYFKNYCYDIKKLSLPIVHYRNEQLHMIVNHHTSNYSTSKNGLITLRNVKRGKYYISIKYIHNIFLVIIRYIFSSVGIICLLIVYIKYYIKRCQNL